MRGIKRAVLVFGLAGLGGLLGLAGCEAGSTPTEPGEDALLRVGPGVSEALAVSGGARVVIALKGEAEAEAELELEFESEGEAEGEPASAVGRVDLSRLERRVGVVREGFLDRVGSDLEGARGFSTVSALVGTVTSEAALGRLAADRAVARIDLDVGGTGGLGSSVAHIAADTRHARSNDGAGVVVAILDTGIQRDHPSLIGRVVAEACFGGPAGFCHNGTTRQTGYGAGEDDAGHGTHVAGIVASSGAVGSPGVAPGASLVSVKVTDNCSFAGCFQSFAEIVAALDWLAVNHDELRVRVVNMSLGTSALFEGACDETTAYNMAGAQAVAVLRQLGVVVVAAAMNDGSRTQMGSPACLSGVVAVGATNNGDLVASFSNVNGQTALFAPGVNIESLAMGGGTRIVSGTSMAAPHVVGCAALLAQASPSLTAGALIDRLLVSEVQVTEQTMGWTLPRLDCRAGTDGPDPEVTVSVERPAGS